MIRSTRLIVVMALDLADNGELVPAFDAMQFDSEDRAIRIARDLSNKHHGVLAWSREAQPDTGEYGPLGILFQSGEVPTWCDNEPRSVQSVSLSIALDKVRSGPRARM
jgi:hypothetical protein